LEEDIAKQVGGKGQQMIAKRGHRSGDGRTRLAIAAADVGSACGGRRRINSSAGHGGSGYKR
jgi:hypothetical protein